MGVISWTIACLYDTVMQRAEEACLAEWRRELLTPLTGEILEVGAGTGVNLPYYTQSVARLTLTEPDRYMRSQLTPKLAAASQNIPIFPAPAEQLPFPDNTFDAVVATLVFCSVSVPDQSLREIHRVLVPGGRLAIIEHVRADDDGRLFRWQRRIEPIWKRCAGNCHLARDTLAAIDKAGFNSADIRRDTMRGAFALVAPVIRGIAKKH
jgi:ubiquinone/menaquinone biosynthesis C-methylase UbiE